MKLTKKERTQKDIIQSAKKIIHNLGYESLTVRRLANETGFSYPNLYYYFKDLDTLCWELRLVMIEDMINELSSSDSTKKNPVDELVETLNIYISYYFENPNVFRFFYFNTFTQPEGDDSYKNLQEKFNKMWLSSFNRLIQENILNIEDMEVVVKIIINSLHGMITLSFSSNGSMSKEDIESELQKIIHHLFKNN